MFDEVVGIESESILPSGFSLNQNYPNPFNPVTIIGYSIPKSSEVKLTIYNLLGRTVFNLTATIQEAGFHSVRWDASKMLSGVYYYRLKAGDFT